MGVKRRREKEKRREVIMKTCKNCGSTNLYKNEDKLVCAYCGCKMESEEKKVAHTQQSNDDDGYIKAIMIGGIVLFAVAIVVTVLFVVITMSAVKTEMNNTYSSLDAAETETETVWYQATGPIDRKNVEVAHTDYPVILDGKMEVYNSFDTNHKMVKGNLKNVGDKDLYNVNIMVYYAGDRGGIMLSTIDKIAAKDTACIILIATGNDVEITKVVCVLENGQRYEL